PKTASSSFRANALNSRGIVGAGNPGRFAPTSWWSGGIRTDGHRRSLGDLELFLSSRVNAGQRSGQGHVQQIVVEVETSGDSQATFRLRIDASSIVMLRQNGYFPSPDSPSLGP